MRFTILLAIFSFATFALCSGPVQAQTVTRQATLTWTAPTACEGGAALTNCPVKGYSVQKLTGTTWTQIGVTAANVLTYVDQDLPIGTHTYRVIATSDAGNSKPSNESSKTIAVPGAPGNIAITVTVTIS